MASSDFNRVVDRYHETLNSFLRGDPEPTTSLWARRDDVLLLNPFGTLALGWSAVAKTTGSVASQVRDGSIRFENLVTYETPELAYIVEIEHASARLGGRQDRSDWDLYTTTIFCRLDGEWQIVHRHATSPKEAVTFESLAQ